MTGILIFTQPSDHPTARDSPLSCTCLVPTIASYSFAPFVREWATRSVSRLRGSRDPCHNVTAKVIFHQAQELIFECGSESEGVVQGVERVG